MKSINQLDVRNPGEYLQQLQLHLASAQGSVTGCSNELHEAVQASAEVYRLVASTTNERSSYVVFGTLAALRERVGSLSRALHEQASMLAELEHRLGKDSRSLAGLPPRNGKSGEPSGEGS
jgi:hypothetical protein